MKKSISIRVAAVVIFVASTLLVATITISLQYIFSSRIATEIVSSYATALSRHIKKNVTELEKHTSDMVKILSQNKSMVSENHVVSDVVDPLFHEILENNSALYNVHIGLENGGFYGIMNLDANSTIRNKMGASPTDRYMKLIVSGVGENKTLTMFFLDENMNITGEKTEFSRYDASSRPWFLNTNHTDATISKPYIFQFLQSPGRTVSMKIAGTNHVVAIDMTLADVSDFLSRQIIMESEHLMKNSEVFLYDSKGTVIVSNLATTEATREETRKIKPVALTQQEREYIQSLSTLRVSNDTSWPPLSYSASGEPRGYVVEKTKMVAESLGLPIKYVNGFSWDSLTHHFRNGDIEILTPVYKAEFNQDWGLFSEPIADTKIALATLSQAPDYRTFEELEGKIVATLEGAPATYEIAKHYPKIKLLVFPSVTEALQAVVNGDADAVVDTEVVLEYSRNVYYFSDIKIVKDINIHAHFDTSLYYLVHNEHKPLLDLINRALKQFTVQDDTYLKYKWLDSDNRKILVKTLSNSVPYNELLIMAEGELSYDQLQRHTINSQDKFIFVSPLSDMQDQFFSVVLNVDDVLADSKSDVYISIMITSSIIMLLLPFCWFLANPIVYPIRQLVLKNAKTMQRKYEQVKRQHFIIKEIDDLDDSLVKMSKSIARYEAQQQNLMDSFVKLIAQAIDDKSPYTGEHCHRVPELGLMLADAASQDQSDYFKNFDFENPDKRREFQLAAWLHDCGKITTPEHLVDKGSKLETCYNRIHEIRTRFEVIWRDLEIHYYQKLFEDPSRQQELQQAKVEAQQLLVDEFSFIAKCNVGSEGMKAEDIERLNHIGAKKWLRHFDDQIGLSPLEEARLKRESAALPVEEYLLDNKPEHEIEWEVLPTYDPKHGITLQAPTLQNNQGELYNLSINQGTLNNEERYRVQGHTVSTIRILDSLPFPPELANVPKYASTHHETLKGTGYPRGLSAEHLTIEERILVLSDIYEALTAGDRPYKKAKPLSVALKIMRNMVLDHHIDKEVFNLFLNSGIYLNYAKQYINKEQLDEVNPKDYLV